MLGRDGGQELLERRIEKDEGLLHLLRHGPLHCHRLGNLLQVLHVDVEVNVGLAALNSGLVIGRLKLRSMAGKEGGEVAEKVVILSHNACKHF